MVFLVLGASALGDRLKDAGRWPRVVMPLAVGLATAAAGLTLGMVLPLSKHLLTASYLLVTGGAATALLGVVGLVDRPWPLVASLGRNPLVMYMAGGILTLIVRGTLSDDLAEPWAWTAGLTVLGLMTAAAWVLDRNKWYVRL